MDAALFCSREYGLRCPWDAPDAAFMVLPLGPAPLSPGLVSYRDEFSTVT